MNNVILYENTKAIDNKFIQYLIRLNNLNYLYFKKYLTEKEYEKSIVQLNKRYSRK